MTLLDEETAPKEGPIPDEAMAAVMQMLQQALVQDLEDKDQTKLIDALQQNRAFILKYAMQKYLESPKSASLLEGVTSLLAHMEKTVRDNRKEALKKQENENNIVSFNQMLEAMKQISSGAVALPVFDIGSFILDPNKSLIENQDVAPIKAEELQQGNVIVDLDGNPV